MATPDPPQIQLNPVASLNALSFYWGPPSTMGPDLIIGYQLICSSINFVQNFTSTACYAQVSSLTNTTDLVFQLAAKNINGTGPFTPFLTAEPGIASAGVGSVTASTFAFGQALVQWSYSTNQNEGNIYGFSLSVINQGSSTLVFSMYPNQSSLTIRNLTSPLNYNFLGLNNYGISKLTYPVTDNLFNGKNRTFLFTLQNPVSNIFYIPRNSILVSDKLICTKQYVLIRCRNISPDYCKFIISENTNSAIFGTPYFNPTNVYSNIIGGLGLIGGMTERTDTVWIRK